MVVEIFFFWQKGIRGRIWSYIDALYSKSVRQVRVGGALSAHVTIDLGVAQGDTLSCTLYDIYVDDLTDAYDSAGAGVSLPACQPGGGTTDHRIHSFIFADDFLGVA